MMMMMTMMMMEIEIIENLETENFFFVQVLLDNFFPFFKNLI